MVGGVVVLTYRDVEPPEWAHTLDAMRDRIRRVTALDGAAGVVIFTREHRERRDVERLQSLISMLKGETFGLARTRRFFS